MNKFEIWEFEVWKFRKIELLSFSNRKSILQNLCQSKCMVFLTVIITSGLKSCSVRLTTCHFVSEVLHKNSSLYTSKSRRDGLVELNCLRNIFLVISNFVANNRVRPVFFNFKKPVKSFDSSARNGYCPVWYSKNKLRVASSVFRIKVLLSSNPLWINGFSIWINS